MIQALHRRLRNGRQEEGFTLIELMVVVMIIAILVAIAIPSFFSARKRAQDSSAKSSLQVSLSDAQAIYTDDQEYGTSATLFALLGAEEPNITFVDHDAASTGPDTVSVNVGNSDLGTEDVVVLASKSKSGKCFFLAHVATPGVTGAMGLTAFGADSASGTWKAEEAVASCTADAANGTNWNWEKQNA